jgi:NADH dehydrogenase FAD-containing subunit
MEDISRKRILILRGGFVGVAVAMELEKRLAHDGVEIRLVNRDNFFLFTPMLHEVPASDLDLMTIVNPVRKLLEGCSFSPARSSISILHKRKLLSPMGSTTTNIRSSSITFSSAWDQ